ncbi:hypothetical protein C8Q76DRAFT_750574 [Earliella scabrosa]|nr:hypothetical protein C8Q76DRAFT_750574 [Earliella scabrosa]
MASRALLHFGWVYARCALPNTCPHSDGLRGLQHVRSPGRYKITYRGETEPVAEWLPKSSSLNTVRTSGRAAPERLPDQEKECMWKVRLDDSGFEVSPTKQMSVLLNCRYEGSPWLHSGNFTVAGQPHDPDARGGDTCRVSALMWAKKLDFSFRLQFGIAEKRVERRRRE